jgi:hypothetical protein
MTWRPQNESEKKRPVRQSENKPVKHTKLVKFVMKLRWGGC